MLTILLQCVYATRVTVNYMLFNASKSMRVDYLPDMTNIF